jgi:hypothetical protein
VDALPPIHVAAGPVPRSRGSTTLRIRGARADYVPVVVRADVPHGLALLCDAPCSVDVEPGRYTLEIRPREGRGVEFRTIDVGPRGRVELVRRGVRRWRSGLAYLGAATTSMGLMVVGLGGLGPALGGCNREGNGPAVTSAEQACEASYYAVIDTGLAVAASGVIAVVAGSFLLARPASDGTGGHRSGFAFAVAPMMGGGVAMAAGRF